MNSVDVEIVRLVRREFNKRPIDSTRLDVQVTNSRVSLAGIVGNLRDQPDVNVKDEIAHVMKMLTRDRLVKDVQDLTRVIQGEKEDEETNSRGRMRPGR